MGSLCIGRAMAQLWGDPGQPVSWRFCPSTTAIGSRVDIAGDLVSYDDEMGSCVFYTWPGKQKARIFKGLVNLGDDIEAFSVYGAVYSDNVDIPGFCIDERSEVLQHPRLRLQDLFQVVELCSGMGIGTQGLIAAGLRTVVACEKRPLMAQAFRELHPGTPVVVGDVGDDGTIIEIYQHHKRSSVLMAGFSCQPFSSGGQQMGIHDTRAQSLPGILRAVKMLRSPLVMLECVKGAGSNRFVRNLLDTFKEEFHFSIGEGILKLEDCWVAKRERWWAVLSAPCFGLIAIPPMPVLPFPTKLRHVLLQPFDGSDDDMQQLVLTEAEMKQLLQLSPKFQDMYLPMNGKAPTCLHSWGSQFGPCPCGCRMAFSQSTLQERGIYGVFVPTGKGIEIDGNHQPLLRHPHPAEVGWANGFLIPEQWPQPLRLSLAGLGQMASPLQVVWVAAQLVHHIGRLHFGASDVSGHGCLEKHMQKVLDQSRQYYGALGQSGLLSSGSRPDACVHDADVEMEQVPQLKTPEAWSGFQHLGTADEVTVIDSESRAVVVIRLASASTSLRELLVAERALSLVSSHVLAFDCVTSQPVGSSDVVAGRCLWLESFPVDFAMDGCASASNAVVSPTLAWPVEDEPVPVPKVVDGVSALGVKGDISSWSDPLIQLKDTQFVGVLPPRIDGMINIAKLACQTLSSDARECILHNQCGKWSDDEITWHVERILAESGKKDWAFLPVLLACEGIRRNCVKLISQWIEGLPRYPSVLVSAVAVEGHWIPFIWRWTAAGLTSHSWDIPGPTPRCLNILHDAISKVVGARSYMSHVDMRQFSETDFCGLCTVRWIDHKVRGRMLPTDNAEVHYLHDVARTQFSEFLRSQVSVPRPWIWAAGMDLKAHNRFQDLLLQHGVPSTQVEARMHLVSQKIGTVEVQNAMTSGNPWRSLKTLANQQKPPLKIVLAEELEAVVKARSSKGDIPAKKKQGKASGKGVPSRPPLLDPEKLELEPGVFVQGEKPLSQLEARHLGPLAEGVFVTTVGSIEAHLKAGQPVSDLGLAALVLNATDRDLDTSLSWSQIRVVLRCKANCQPVLVSAHLIQLGHQIVSQASSKPMFEMPQVEAACIKVAVYRDAIDGLWSDFIAAPIKYILAVLMPLMVCGDCGTGPPSACVKWHVSSTSPVAEPVLDIWRRQWTSATFKPCNPETAAIFWVNVRYLLDRQEAVLRCSGQKGVFVEPRSLDGRGGTLDFQVLWLPKESLSELQRLQQCHVIIQGLARLGSRMGLRVATTDAPSLSRLVKPGTVYLSSGERSDYEAGPLPFGMDRLSMTRLCEAWKWQARPLHPIRSTTLGTIWLLQSCQDPPNTVLKYQGGDIVINKACRRSAPVPSSHVPVVGASDTMALCKLDSSGDVKQVDPWLKEDPWQAAVAKPSVPLPGVEAGSQLQQLELKIEKNIMARLAVNDGDVDMDSKGTADVEARFAVLENQVQCLAAKQSQIDVKMEENVQRADAQISQFQSQVAAQFDAQRGEMQGLFTLQMSQIEALLSKKARHE